jgi:hypothetical protein
MANNVPSFTPFLNHFKQFAHSLAPVQPQLEQRLKHDISNAKNDAAAALQTHLQGTLGVIADTLLYDQSEKTSEILNHLESFFADIPDRIATQNPALAAQLRDMLARCKRDSSNRKKILLDQLKNQQFITGLTAYLKANLTPNQFDVLDHIMDDACKKADTSNLSRMRQADYGEPERKLAQEIMDLLFTGMKMAFQMIGLNVQTNRPDQDTSAEKTRLLPMPMK